jgi:hypothetical protein
MWRNDTQRSAAIRTLLKAARVERFWTSEGPSSVLVELAEGGFRSSPYSHGETVMLQVAMDFWNGSGKALWADLLEVLDLNNLQNTVDLAVAVANGGDAVDRWITEHA